jgi:hypothetical protein
MTARKNSVDSTRTALGSAGAISSDAESLRFDYRVGFPTTASSSVAMQESSCDYNGNLQEACEPPAPLDGARTASLEAVVLMLNSEIVTMRAAMELMASELEKVRSWQAAHQCNCTSRALKPFDQLLDRLAEQQLQDAAELTRVVASRSQSPRPRSGRRAKLRQQRPASAHVQSAAAAGSSATQLPLLNNNTAADQSVRQRPASAAARLPQQQQQQQAVTGEKVAVRRGPNWRQSLPGGTWVKVTRSNGRGIVVQPPQTALVAAKTLGGRPVPVLKRTPRAAHDKPPLRPIHYP